FPARRPEAPRPEPGMPTERAGKIRGAYVRRVQAPRKLPPTSICLESPPWITFRPSLALGGHEFNERALGSPDRGTPGARGGGAGGRWIVGTTMAKDELKLNCRIGRSGLRISRK